MKVINPHPTHLRQKKRRRVRNYCNGSNCIGGGRGGGGTCGGSLRFLFRLEAKFNVSVDVYVDSEAMKLDHFKKVSQVREWRNEFDQVGEEFD
ncbi:hypothetical protein MGN70_014122 [Eutypa lata]|nr:hypothetical protein MGN70_014122 [Eutypa lata]